MCINTFNTFSPTDSTSPSGLFLFFEKQDSSTTTIDYIGEFENSLALRNEFFESLKYS